MSKKKFPVLSVALYILAGLLGLYTIWAAKFSFDYISRMIEQNQLVISGNEFEVVSFHMSNFAQYALFAVILFTLGWMLQVNSPSQALSEELEDYDDDDDEEDLEDWIEENDK